MCFSALTSSFAQNKNIKDLYEQLDQAIKQSQYYINQKESRITKIKKQSRQGHTPQQLLTAYYKLYEEYKAYQSDSSIYYIHQAIDLAKKKQHEERHYQVEKLTCFTIFNIRSFHGGTSCSTKYR